MRDHGSAIRIAPIFATPFASIDTGAEPDLNTQLTLLCNSLGEQAHNLPHFRGGEQLLSAASEPANALRRLILGSASGVIAELGAAKSPGFERIQVEAQAWFSIVPPEGHIGAQQFPGASWLAVYCVQAGEPASGTSNAGVLRLYETRLGSVYRDQSSWTMKPPYRFGNHTWRPIPGRMAMFPAHMPHEVSLVRSSKPLILVFATLRFIDPIAHDSRYG